MVAVTLVTRHMRQNIEATFKWNCLIAQEAQLNPQASLSSYKSMQARAIPPNTHTFPALLKACAALRNPLHPIQLHAHLSRLGLLLLHKHASSSLIDAYGKCGLPNHALQLFEELPQQALDAFSWTALISSLSLNCLTPLAIQIFTRMRRYDDPECRVDAVILATLVSASDTLLCGQAFHAIVIKHGFLINTRLANTLVHKYAILEAVDDALMCFNCIPLELRDVVSWNVIIAGLAMNGKNEKALLAFDDMVEAGVAPNPVTLISVLKSCGQLGCIEMSQHIHDYVTSHHPPQADDVVILTALVDMHARCGQLELARQIFDGIEGKNVVCWSAMIAGFEQSSRPDEALLLFRRMLAEEGVKPNAVTMLSVIAACSMIGASRPGRIIHKYAFTSGLGNDTRVSSGLIDMYAKCGEIELSRKVFLSTDHIDRTVVSWTAMIGAEGLHGEGRRALHLFSEMRDLDFQPNDVTFVSLLSACSHSGLVEEGISCFEGMERDHGVSPNAKHYACIVDLLGRAGRLIEAHDIICKMPVEADAAVWGCLLGACHVHGNCELGEVVEKQILNMDPGSVGHRVLLANMYSNAGRWEDVIRMRAELRKNRLVKIAGFSFIEVGNKVYGFTAEDWSHQESELIYEELRDLDAQVRDAGYVKELPSIAGDNHLDVETAATVEALTRSEYHSERLAIAFGIMISSRGHSRQSEPIRITKNLRVCRDCHVYSKFVSKVIKRELIVRDSHRFHHFKDGLCSCKDYW